MDESEEIKLAVVSKKAQFRVEIRSKKQANSLQESRKKLDVEPNIQNMNFNGQVLKEELQMILLRLGGCDRGDSTQLNTIFDSLLHYILEVMDNDKERISEFKSIFQDDSKCIFMLESILWGTKVRDQILLRQILLGNLLCFSDDICRILSSDLKYLMRFNEIVIDNKSDEEILMFSLSCLYNLLADPIRRSQVFTSVNLIQLLTTNPPLQKHNCEEYVNHYLDVVQQVMAGPSHLEVNVVSPLFAQLYFLLFNAYKFDEPEKIVKGVINAIFEYVSNNSNENILGVLIRQSGLLTFIVRSITAHCTGDQKENGNVQKLQEEFIEVKRSNRKQVLKENSNELKMLTIIVNITAIDFTPESNKALTSFYTTSNLISSVSSWINYSNVSRQGLMNIAGLLSNIALSDAKTHSLLLSNDQLSYSLMSILKSSSHTDIVEEFFLIPINIACLATLENCERFVDLGFFDLLLSKLSESFLFRNDSIKYALSGIEKILELGEEIKNNKRQDKNSYAYLIMSHGYQKCIEELSYHDNEQISEIAAQILETYF